MESRCEAILSTLFGVSLKYGKRYCYPSQGRIETLLFDYHDFDISNRTLNRDLRLLEDEGYLKRVRRTKRVKGMGKVFTSTLYKFRVKAFIYLNSLAKEVKRIFSVYRLPKMADYKSINGNEISLSASALCGNPVENVIKGGPTEPKETLPGLRE